MGRILARPAIRQVRVKGQYRACADWRPAPVWRLGGGGGRHRPPPQLGYCSEPPFLCLPFSDCMNDAARPSIAPPPPVTSTSGITSRLPSDSAFAIATAAVGVEPRLATWAS